MTNFKDALEKRRSVYNLNKSSNISDEKIENLIEHAIKHTPTAFNSQTGRVVLLLNDAHDKLWEITRGSLKAIMPEEAFVGTSQKIDSFKNAYGTILYFEDQEIIKGLQEQFAAYSHNFPIWSNQAAGMLQSNIWTSLALEGLGASLQHYNELIEVSVKEEWSIDSKWKLLAQMPFGDIGQAPDVKEFSPIDGRFKVFK